MTPQHILFSIIAFAISVVIQFFIIRFSHKKGLFLDDHTSDLPQKMHEWPVPRMGGLGIFLAAIVFACLSKVGLTIFLCSIPAFFAGFFEDLNGNVSPKKRLLIMTISAIAAIYFLNAIVVDFGAFSTPLWLGIFISFIAIVGLINGTNLIDGFNGLLALICLIIFLSFAILSYKFDQVSLFQVCLVMAAALIGFILFNYPTAKVFMGDGGAYFLGFVAAVVGILLAINCVAISPFVILLCIIHPVIEVIYSFGRRGIINKTSPFEPDDRHLHTLINKGLVNKSNPKTVLVILPFVIFFNAMAIIFYNNQLALILLVIIYVILYFIAYFILAKKVPV
jgi:UDP-GlcNAc:undecaprenyl-phosphate/decaprenyl-phosphate GlcNAc-1-phosphate transferase